MTPFSLITIPIAALFISQALKLATDKVKGNFTWHNLLHDYGGMPSSHSAFVASLTTEIALLEGINSPLFAVTFIFSLIIIRDALGLRNNLAKANAEINKLNKNAQLIEKLGHTPIEIFTGCLVGILIVIIAMMFFV